MKKKIAKGTKEWQLFVDFWNMCQEYWIPEENDDYWNNIVKATGELSKKYSGNILAQKLCLAFVEAQDEIFKKGSAEK